MKAPRKYPEWTKGLSNKEQAKWIWMRVYDFAHDGWESRQATAKGQHGGLELEHLKNLAEEVVSAAKKAVGDSKLEPLKKKIRAMQDVMAEMEGGMEPEDFLSSTQRKIVSGLIEFTRMNGVPTHTELHKFLHETGCPVAKSTITNSLADAKISIATDPPGPAGGVSG